jgi:hypothetical protein
VIFYVELIDINITTIITVKINAFIHKQKEVIRYAANKNSRVIKKVRNQDKELEI